MLSYAGIGSRSTPDNVQEAMRGIAVHLARNGLCLRSGHADGADKAFERGALEANGPMQIFLPWEGFNGAPKNDDRYIVPNVTKRAMEMATAFHPNWARCSQGAQKMHIRNCFQILGPNLNDPAKVVICYTPNGDGSGGTGQAMRIATYYGIPIIDLGNQYVVQNVITAIENSIKNKQEVKKVEPFAKRLYPREQSTTFLKTREAFGELSNMHNDFPLDVDGDAIPSSEALYQALKFPDYPEVQKEIVTPRNSMEAKRIARRYTKEVRGDWNEFNVKVMQWCLHVKFCQYKKLLWPILMRTQNFIVECSYKDQFWGATPQPNGDLIGTNLLGRLWRMIREELKETGTLSVISSDQYGNTILKKPDIFNFTLFGSEIEDQIIIP